MGTLLNGFELTFSAEIFEAYVSAVADPGHLRDMRSEEKGQWFFWWRDGTLYAIPEVAEPARRYGELTKLSVRDHRHLGLLASRLSYRLPEKFPAYHALRRKPFAFLGQKDELVARATSRLRSVSPLVSRFTIRPKFELDARLYELRDGETKVGLFVAVSTRWEITAPLSDLQAAGVRLAGLTVVRRNPQDKERRLVGRIQSVENGIVHFSESYDDVRQLAQDQVWLEGSRVSFRHCLGQLLQHDYPEFDERRSDAEGELLGGPGLEKLYQKMGEVLSKYSPIAIAPNMECVVGERIAPRNEGNYKTVTEISKGEYCFDPAKKKRTEYAWPGIERYGPFSRDTFSTKSPRILVLAPDKITGKVSQFVGLLNHGITSVKHSRYAGGFSKLFHLHNPEFSSVTIPVLGAADHDVSGRYRETIESALRKYPDYDAALVALLDEHSWLDDALNPYLHAKAMLLSAGVPVQHFRISTATQPEFGLQYILQNIAVSLYSKMGGVPWTVDQGLAVDDELVIGIGVAEMSGSRFSARQRYVGITTVFRGDGNYLLGHLSRDSTYDEYPKMLRENTVRVLHELRERNGWRNGDTIRLVFHAHRPLKKIEVARIVKDCVSEVGVGLQVQFAFLTVSHDHPFRVTDPDFRGIKMKTGQMKAALVPARGRVVQLGRYTRLLCTKGPTLIKRAQTPLPSPILINLHPDSTYRDLQYLSEQVLKFTNLSWRGTQPAEDPVTIY